MAMEDAATVVVCNITENLYICGWTGYYTTQNANL